jgi:hypothetical protein
MLRLRIDDYPGAKPAEFDKHNLKNFLKFYDLLDKRVGKQFLLGVIPKHTADAELIFIGALPNVVVGMHGIDHDERFLNEFRNHLTTKDVTTKLKNSRERLQHLTKQNVDVYMPPHNIVDRPSQVGQRQICSISMALHIAHESSTQKLLLNTVVLTSFCNVALSSI